MEATNQTNNLGLPQWEQNDKVIRADFNEAFDIIDDYALIGSRNRKTISNMFQGFMAHRGAQSVAPENTIKAISKAEQLGYKFVEIDPRKTSDGYWILMHDTTVDRTTNGTGTVSSMSLAEIQALKIDMPASLIDPDEIIRVPLLEDVLKTCSACNLGVNIDGEKFDINQSNIEVIYEYLVKYRLDTISFVICPTQASRELVRQYTNGLRVGWMSTAENVDNDIAEAATYDNNAIVAYNAGSITTTVASKCNSAGLDIFVYGISSIADAYYWAQYGIKYIETDYILPGGRIW